MNASEMRKLTMEQLNLSAGDWWNTYKEDLFREIEHAAKSGKYRYEIGVDSKLSDDGKLLENGVLMRKITNELNELGFETQLSGGTYYKDGRDKCFIISWNG